ncbi:MAG: OsmC family protein [Thermomicrobiales bacterium]
MAVATHTYHVTTTWTGNSGSGTSGQAGYSRDHSIEIDGKPALEGSSDPAFLGDPARHNPEDLLVASLSACHMLWFLSLAARARVIVTAYVDRAEGMMETDRGGGGRFTKVVLRPLITLEAGTDVSVADALHHDAHEKCFISQSVNFPVTIEAEYR